MVRDEVDIIDATLDHLLTQDIDHLLVSDNGSVDGTLEMLQERSRRDHRVHLALDREPAYFQSEKMSLLIRAASRAGADWVVPFDADEFWFARDRSVGDTLRRLAHEDPEVGIVSAAFHHMVPAADVAKIGPATDFVLDATPSLPGKVAVRAHWLAGVSMGNHFGIRVGSRFPGLFIAHAVFRSHAQVARKLRQGAAAVNLAGGQQNVGAHWRYGGILDDAAIADVWGRLRDGHAEPALGLPAVGPMVQVRPLSWSRWDPDGVVVAAPTGDGNG
jgi:hypothetical protein